MGIFSSVDSRNNQIVGGNSTNLDSIPDDLLFEIIVRLPAQDIYFGARLVCRKWYHMIHTKNFIHKHREHASYGILYWDKFANLFFSSAREDGGGIVDTYKLNYSYYIPDVWSSWNGLMVEYDEFPYRVTNILTGQILCLPPCPFDVRYVYFHGLCGIGYDATSMTYKVIVSYRKESGEYGCAILTLGVDKSWRFVHLDHLSDVGKDTILCFPIITEGYVNWKRSNGTDVVTLNLETELIVEILPPKVEKNIGSVCLSTGRYLSLLVKHERLMWEIFEMKPEIGEWRKFANICLEGQQGRIEKLCLEGQQGRIEMFRLEDAHITPFGWLKYPEVLALRVDPVWFDSVIIFYNLIKCEVGAEKLPNFYGLFVTLHKNSLEWLCRP